MRDDFAIFIPTHKRPNNIKTLRLLEKVGYTGKTFLVVDDQDPTLEQYKKAHPDRVLVFSKEEEAKRTDAGNNFLDRRSVVYARNAIFDLARQVGVRFFLVLDDDYKDVYSKFDRGAFYGNWPVKKGFDRIVECVLSFLESAPNIRCLAFLQQGDFMGGKQSNTAEGIKLYRKIMNSFFCDVERPFLYAGEMNDDVNTYVTLAPKGALFLSTNLLSIDQTDTQEQEGGLTDLYLDMGTYTKSFYTVMMAPSCVKVEASHSMGRIHHFIDSRKAYPKILDPKHKKAALPAPTGDNVNG
jgi:hypothetical protein